jgi:hypothetical protein
MPGHFGGSHSHGDKTKKGSDRGHSRFSSGSGYYGGTTKTKTTSQGADDKKVAYLTSTKGKTNAKKAAETKAKNKIKKDMEDFANLTYQPPKFTGPAGAIYSGLLGEKTFNVNKQYYTRNVIGKTNPKTGQAYAGTVKDFETYMRGRGSGELDAMGRTINRSDNDGGGRVIIEKKVGGSTILTETKTEAEKTAEAKEDAEYDARKTKRRGRRRTILTSQTGATGNLQLGKRSLLGV